MAFSDDLAANRPGADLQVKADDLRRAHPVASWFLRLVGEHSDERAWRRGAEGEQEVAAKLSMLGDSWEVLHAIPVGSGETDIDHLVIGLAGVFCLNTKNHRGGRVKVTEKAIYVNGKYQPYIAKSRGEAKRATKLLSSALGRLVEVEPVLVVLASDFTVQAQPEGVSVIGRKRIAKWLAAQPPRITHEEVDAVYAAARQRSTWISR